MKEFLHDLWAYICRIKDRDYMKKIEAMKDRDISGLDNFVYKTFRSRVLDYVASMRVDEFEYRFSADVQEACLYASVFAFLTLDLFDEIDVSEDSGWTAYFDSFQRKDGLFYDKRQYTKRYDTGEGWGAHHLVPHILIAYDALHRVPAKRFSYITDFFDSSFVERWLNKMNWKNSWAASNAVMNTGITLLYMRDFQNIDIGTGLYTMEDWLMKHMHSDLPFWHDGVLLSKYALFDAIRGAYHMIPILVYEDKKIPNCKAAIKKIISVQNRWGGFDYNITSSACDDMDAIDLLIRYMKMTGCQQYFKENMLRAFGNVMSNQNADGGFCFSRARNGFIYGDCKNMTSRENNSNLFGTWFRTVCVLEMLDYFGIRRFKGSRVPGYEYMLDRQRIE